MECNKQKNLTNCTCTFSCSKKGMCCECLNYHRPKGELPGCYFSEAAEATGNRSIEFYMKDEKNRR